MAKIECFSPNNIEQIARILQGCMSHAELNMYFESNNLDSMCGQSSSAKWSRINATFLNEQNKHQCSNHLCKFIHHLLEPVRFCGRPDDFRDLRDQLNEVLAYNGMQVGEDGKLRPVKAAKTQSDAMERVGRLKAALQHRGVHADVLKFCREELIQQNYFHAVLEATKSVADKIRSRTGLTGDGYEIVDQAFNVKTPMLAINSLRTDTERSEHTGFATLLKGTFGTFRNPHAHAPKISWPISEEDALDLLTLVSYLHRRLDKAVLVPRLTS